MKDQVVVPLGMEDTNSRTKGKPALPLVVPTVFTTASKLTSAKVRCQDQHQQLRYSAGDQNEPSWVLQLRLISLPLG